MVPSVMPGVSLLLQVGLLLLLLNSEERERKSICYSSWLPSCPKTGMAAGWVGMSFR